MGSAGGADRPAAEIAVAGRTNAIAGKEAAIILLEEGEGCATGRLSSMPSAARDAGVSLSGVTRLREAPSASWTLDAQPVPSPYLRIALGDDHVSVQQVPAPGSATSPLGSGGSALPPMGQDRERRVGQELVFPDHAVSTPVQAHAAGSAADRVAPDPHGIPRSRDSAGMLTLLVMWE